VVRESTNQQSHHYTLVNGCCVLILASFGLGLGLGNLYKTTQQERSGRKDDATVCARVFVFRRMVAFACIPLTQPIRGLCRAKPPAVYLCTCQTLGINVLTQVFAGDDKDVPPFFFFSASVVVANAPSSTCIDTQAVTF